MQEDAAPSPTASRPRPRSRGAAWGLSALLHAGLVILLLVGARSPAPAPAGPPLTVTLLGIEPPGEEAQEPPPRAREPVDAVAWPDVPVQLPAAEVFEDLPDAPLSPAPRPPPAPPDLDPERIRPRAPRARRAPPPAAAPAPELPPTEPAASPSPAVGPAPRILRRPDLRGYYPEAARRQGLEGTAIVRVEVDARGRVVRATLEQGSGSRLLDEAALRVARRYAFTRGARAEALLPVIFRLRD